MTVVGCDVYHMSAVSGLTFALSARCPEHATAHLGSAKVLSLSGHSVYDAFSYSRWRHCWQCTACII